MDNTTTVEIDGLRVEIKTGRGLSGDLYVELVPDNCTLEGEEPCLYYLVPLAS